MPELITLDRGAAHVRLAAQAVSIHEYRAYLRGAGLPTPPLLAGAPRAAEPVTCISQVEALAYCDWLSGQDGRAYRLPSIAELLELAGEEGFSADVWPCTRCDQPEVQGQRGSVYLCEWTCETETLPGYGSGEQRVLGSVFYPPWLREGNNPTHIQAMMLATQGYSFVSFRVATDFSR
jgi:hypothetical protein